MVSRAAPADPLTGSVLVVGPAWVGDMVMAQTLFIELARRRRGLCIDVIAPAWTLPLLERMPQVRRAIPLQVQHGELQLVNRWRAGWRLRTTGYTQAIVLPNSWKSALVPYAAGIGRRTGFFGEGRYGVLNDIRRLDKRLPPTTVERFVALGVDAGLPLPRPLPRPKLEIDAAARTSLLDKQGLDPARGPVVAMAPGAEYGPAKRWPVAHFVTVAKSLLARGVQVWLFGSQKDRAQTDEIHKATGNRCVNLAGETSLGEACDLLSVAELVITNDSGLMHVAAALDRRLICIYGSSDPRFTPPLTERATVLTLGLDCSPCFERTCPLGHTNCLNQLTPDRVLAAVTGVLG